MKKNNVAIDVVSFGEEEVNESKLKAFIDAVNRDDNSHYISIPSGSNIILSDALMGTPILSGSVSSGDTFDASYDPELAHAIELSLREAERQAQQQGGGSEMEVEEVVAVEGQNENEDEDDEGSLAQAIAMSYQNQQPMDMDEELQMVIQQSLAESQQQQQQQNQENQEAQTEEEVSPEDLKNIFQSLPGVDLNDPNIQEILKKKKDQEKK